MVIACFGDLSTLGRGEGMGQAQDNVYLTDNNGKCDKCCENLNLGNDCKATFSSPS